MRKSYPFSLVLLSSLILGFSVFFITSCQESTLDSTNIEKVELSNTDLRETMQLQVIDYYSRGQINQLNVEDIAEEYQGIVERLDADEADFLSKAIENAALTMPQLPQSAGFRSSITLSEGNDGDGFGRCVLTQGNRVFVGANGQQKVYEYKKTGGNYSLVAEVSPEGASDDFGYQVSVSGSWMAVGAPDFGPPFDGRPGQVFLYKKQGNNWVQKDILSGPPGEFNFGGDGVVLKGNQLAITSRAGGFPSPGGTITVFTLDGNSWTESSTINLQGYDFISIDMNEGGTRIVGTGFINNSVASVRATIFNKQNGSWIVEDDVEAGSFFTNGVGFPRDIAIDGDNIVLTALVPGDKQFLISNSQSGWAINQELTIPVIAPFTNRWCDIKGNKLVIGVWDTQGMVNDDVFLFKKSGEAWLLDKTLAADGDNAFMWSVAISGNTVVAGLPGLLTPSFDPAPGKVSIFE